MNAKPIIQSVNLPWQVSYSATALVVKVAEASGLEITIYANMLYNKNSAEVIAPDSARHEDFDSIADKLLILTDFVATIKAEGPYWLQVSPAYSDAHGINPEEFDWSFIEEDLRPHTKLPSNEDWKISRHRFKKNWYSTGYCPSPQIYYLRNSIWLNSLSGIPDIFRRELAHYIITAHDHRVDIITRKFNYTLVSFDLEEEIRITGEIAVPVE